MLNTAAFRHEAERRGGLNAGKSCKELEKRGKIQERTRPKRQPRPEELQSQKQRKLEKPRDVWRGRISFGGCYFANSISCGRGYFAKSVTYAGVNPEALVTRSANAGW